MMQRRQIPFLLAIFLSLLNLESVAGVTTGFVKRQFTSKTPLPWKSRMKDLPGKLESLNLETTVTRCRGGDIRSDDESDQDEYEEYDEYDEEDQESSDTEMESRSKSSPTGSSNGLIGGLFSAARALLRAVSVAFQGSSSSDNDDAAQLSIVGKLMQIVNNMWTAAFSSDIVEESSSSSSSETRAAKKSKSEHDNGLDASDFGSYLAKAYGVPDGRDEEQSTSPSPILGGTLNDALQTARVNARLLVVLIPAAAPKSKAKNDLKAIESFLSADVSAAAKRKARKKGETASFVLWGAKAGSSEATLAMKRLKVKPKGSKSEKRPILVIAYPAQVINSRGVPKLVPKMLVQHHCNPPPSPEAMATWMNELRKRHAKEYVIMQKDLREAQISKERQEGYKESIQSDVERKIREKKQEEERLAKEKAEKERLEALEVRRKEFLESLPEEPGREVKDAITLSVRHSNGQSDKRRFDPDTQLSVVFNWVDAVFEVERELVVLATMNGKQSFSWEDVEEKTLKEAKLGRMVGFRISEKKVDDEKQQDTKEAEEESSK